MAEDKKNHSFEDANEAWSRLSGRRDQYEGREVEDGVQLIDKDTGSLTAQAKDWSEMVEKVGAPLIDVGTSPEDPEQEWTERGAVMTPTQPEAEKADQGRGDLGSVKPEDQDR